MNSNWLKKRKTSFIVFAIEALFLGCEYGITIVNLWLYITIMVKPAYPKVIYCVISVLYLLSAAISSIVIGRIADKTRAIRRLLLASSLLSIGGNIIYAFPYSYWYLLIGRILAGAGHGIRAAFTGEMVRCYEKTEISQKFAVIGAAHALGFTSAPALNIMFEKLNEQIGSFKITYLNATGFYMALFFLIIQIMAFFMVHDISKEYDMKQEWESMEEKLLLSESDDYDEEDDENNDPCSNKKINDGEDNELVYTNQQLNNKDITGDNSGFHQRYTVLWLITRLFSYLDTSILLALQLLETFFIYSLDMCHSMILIGILKWSISAFNVLMFAGGIMSILPCFLFMFCKVTDKMTYGKSAFGAFGYCILQAVQIVWAKQLLSPLGNYIISVPYTLLWVQEAFLREVFITGFLSRMVSAQYQSTVDGIRLGISKIGAIFALSSAPFALAIIDKLGLLYITIEAIVGILIVVRYKTLMDPRILIKSQS